MLTLVERVASSPNIHPNYALALTAEDRHRSRHQFQTVEGESVLLHLKRSTVLRHGDVLSTDAIGENAPIFVTIIAQPEPVITVTANSPLNLLRAAYHLGNRHIALEVQEAYLRLSPDSVLERMLATMPVTLTSEIAPFQPEAGAYHHHHG